MTKIKSRVPGLVIYGQGGGELIMQYGNLGEPFREGVELEVRDPETECHVSVLIDAQDVRRIRDKLSELLGEAVIPNVQGKPAAAKTAGRQKTRDPPLGLTDLLGGCSFPVP